MIKKVFNIRQGFATNSSSTHSLIRLGAYGYDTAPNFDWGRGVVASKKLKLNYLLSQLFDILEYRDWQIMRTWVKDKFGKKYAKKTMSSIDHQSRIVQVVRKSSPEYKSFNLEFYRDLIQYVLGDETIGILIDNDNEDDSLGYREIDGTEFLFNDGDLLEGKKDGEYWILFNPKNGNKIRMSFADVPAPTKSTTPELVDIKITDMCNSGCKFCYQGSTPTGLHADLEYLGAIFDALHDLKTFEVVLGGGDPLEHPEFNEIILLAKNYNLSVSISTRKYDWIIKEFENISNYTPSTVLKSLSAIGVSVSSVDDMKKIIEPFDSLIETNKAKDSHLGIIHSDLYELKEKIKFHIVMGTVTQEQFREMIQYAKEKWIGVLLLGYKTTGRGCEVEPLDYDWWIDTMKQEGLYRFSIDTSMAKKYAKELSENKVDPRTYETLEGKFSCYIDGVKQTISKDSYSDEKEIYPLEMIKETYGSNRANENKIKELFSKF
jgi:organic radical activating enzyme